MGLDMYINSYKKDENVIRLFEKYGHKKVNECWLNRESISFCEDLADSYGDINSIKNTLEDWGNSSGENVIKYAQTISYWWKEYKETGYVPTVVDKKGCSSSEIDAMNFVQDMIAVYEDALSELSMEDIEFIHSHRESLSTSEKEGIYWRRKWDIHEVIESIISNETIGNCYYVPINEEQFSKLVEYGIVSQEVVNKLDFKEYMYFYYLWY